MMLSGQKMIFVLLVSLVISSSVESKLQFDYFKLSLVWPNSYCNQGLTQCKKPIPQNFKFHGLWPYTAEHNHAGPCTDGHFFKNEVAKWKFSVMLPSLWPNLKHQRKDMNFWEREWTKHGACTGMTMEIYFYSALKYALKYQNFYGSLRKSGILFPSNQPYKREVLYDEIAKTLGSSPDLKCIRYANGTQLREVRVCIDYHGVAFDCPIAYHRCGLQDTRILFATKETITKFRKY